MCYGSSASKLFHPYFYFLGYLCYTLGAPESVCYFFSLTTICQTRIHLFVFYFVKKTRTVLFSYKLQLGIYLIILEVSLKFS